MPYPSYSYDPETHEILPNNKPGLAYEWIQHSPGKWLIVHNEEEKSVQVYRVSRYIPSTYSTWSGQAIWDKAEPTPAIKAHALLFGL